MGSIRLKRTAMGSAFALLIHAMLIWGLSILKPQTTAVLLVPENLSVEIWPDLSRIGYRFDKAPVSKRHKSATKDKMSDPVRIVAPDAPVVPPQEAVAGPVRLPPDLASALRTRQICQKALIEGKDLPKGCSGSNRAVVGLPLLPKDKAEHWDRLVAAQQAYRRYKTTEGNTDYWKRVTGLRDYRNDMPKLGAYSDPKWQKFFSPDIKPDSAYQSERDGN